MKFGDVEISNTSTEPFVIADIGVNHEGCLDKAKKIIDDAVEGGADAVKFQTYKAEKIAIVNSPGYWDQRKEGTKTQFELFKKYDCFDFKEYEILAKHCDQAGIIFSSTPFDFEAVDFLFDLVPFYKISSSDITNLPFIRYIAKKDKPVILSTGAANLAEIDIAVRAIKKVSSCEVALLHCVLQYPCPLESAHLNTIKLLKNVYPEFCIGYSDHVPPDVSMLTLTYAFLTGAVIIEKHFTDDKSKSGNDHYHSMNKEDLKFFLNNIKLYKKIIGHYEKDYLENEVDARLNARRSIVTAKDLKIGDTITWDNIVFKRPACGISPSQADYIIGATVNRDIKVDTPIRFEHFTNMVSQKEGI